VISNFLVGATFAIKNEASPALRQILAQARELNLAINKARENLAMVGKLALPAGPHRGAGGDRRPSPRDRGRGRDVARVELKGRARMPKQPRLERGALRET
jgi:hypothetical protein